MNGKGDVLIVDDEPNARKVLSAILSEEGYEVLQSGDVDTATELIYRQPVDAVITDVKMPGKDGMYFFDYMTKNYPDISVIFLTAYGTIESAVAAMTRGAFHYFMKPPDYPALKSVLAKAVECRGLRKGEEQPRKRADHERPVNIVGNTQEMAKLFETIESVRTSPSNVLIC